jgi:CRISPR-associated exonuclease Cas4
MDNYGDDELLMLSGIQHFAFCERQWALIHIEQQWSENVLTVEGHHLHEKADDPFAKENRGDTSILRSLTLVSRKLGLNGIADVVELIKADVSDASGVEISGKTGKWLLLPVEYKRGKPKPDERDEVQLCAQAVCLEEMYKTKIDKGYLYYGETRHRHEVQFTDTLRQLVVKYTNRMHELFSKGITPAPVFKPHCKSCSLKDICLPSSLADQSSVSEYLKNALSD